LYKVVVVFVIREADRPSIIRRTRISLSFSVGCEVQPDEFIIVTLCLEALRFQRGSMDAMGENKPDSRAIIWLCLPYRNRTRLLVILLSCRVT
jgi:hypothetical protein